MPRPALINLEVTPEHGLIAARANTVDGTTDARMVQAPLLRGLLSVGVPLEDAVTASADIAVDRDLRSHRRQSGDLAVGVAAGLALRAEAFSEVVQ